MYERELQIAYETVLFMEECLSAEFNGAHEIYFDHAVDDDGKPFVSVSVSGRDGVETLTKLFGDAIEHNDRGVVTSVPVPIKEYKPTRALN